MTAAIWCPEHEKTAMHTLNEISEETGQVSAREGVSGKIMLTIACRTPYNYIPQHINKRI
jgi:hypothetical protein